MEAVKQTLALQSRPVAAMVRRRVRVGAGAGARPQPAGRGSASPELGG